MKRIAIIGLVGLAFVTANCKSQKSTDTTAKESKQERGGKNKGGDPFTTMDINKDGVLTKAEAKGPIANDFAKIDLDGDGIITRAEFDKTPKPQRDGRNRPARR